ncbi:MAG TPA: 2-C-methyl-D-erythritol 2,4-cyclodiphosphate synthase [Clostridiaceae bacterium]|nr:2-C-methyl-D-erythritol 2,4-cyclodiphosphate synthase [Clostridiaceae bacterium]
MISISAIGQDSHRFMSEEETKATGIALKLGGLTIPGYPALEGNSDADVVLHALTNAISGLTGVRILGAVADELVKYGITDSSVYVERALKVLCGMRLVHLSFSIEAKRPHLASFIEPMREHIANLTGLSVDHVAITATSGEELTAFGRGEAIQCFCIASAVLES